MPQAGAGAWWAEVEHLREDFERRREAERSGFDRIARRPGGRFARGQVEPFASEDREEPGPATGPLGGVELVTPLDVEERAPRDDARRDADADAGAPAPTGRFRRAADQPPPAPPARPSRAELRAQAAHAVALDVPGWDTTPRPARRPDAPPGSGGERRTVHIRGRGAERGAAWTVPGADARSTPTTDPPSAAGGVEAEPLEPGPPARPATRGAGSVAAGSTRAAAGRGVTRGPDGAAAIGAPAPVAIPSQTAARRSASAPSGDRARSAGSAGAPEPSAARTRPASNAGPRRPRRRPQERLGHRPDRVALWALLLGFALALTAALTADAATRLGDRTLERGTVGRDVRHLQLRLKRLGLLDASATARFGALTERAVRRYQRSRCLTVDGIAGRGTIRALRSGRRACRGGTSRRVDGAYRAVELGSRTLARGMAGRDVRTVQHLLGVRTTGTFGPITARAVRAFQRRAGLDADGAVGPATRGALALRRMVVRTATWYGPGLYGRRTACGQRMTRRLVGVAHRRLPCGARVTLHRGGRFVTVPVVDRGPFTRGVSVDLTAATAKSLGLQQTEQLRVAS